MASNPQTPQAGMSSRLLTMKFMQRAAASSSPSATPSSEQPSSKRRKVQPTLQSASASAAVDGVAIQVALEDQEAQRQSALAKHTAEYLDTHWVLDRALPITNAAVGNTLNIEYVGYAAIDASPDADTANRQIASGRKIAGNYRKPTNDAKIPSAQPESGSEGESDDDNSDSSSKSSAEETPAAKNSKTDDAVPPSSGGRARAKLKRHRSLESVKAKEFRDKRRKKEMNLNMLTSISSTSGMTSGKRNSKTGAGLCYKCGKAGHKARDCPTQSNAKLPLNHPR